MLEYNTTMLEYNTTMTGKRPLNRAERRRAVKQNKNITKLFS